MSAQHDCLSDYEEHGQQKGKDVQKDHTQLLRAYTHSTRKGLRKGS